MNIKFSELGPYKTGLRLVLAGLATLTVGAQTGASPGLAVQLIGSLVVLGGLAVVMISVYGALSGKTESKD